MTIKLAQRASKDTSLVASLIDSYCESMNLRWEEIANYLWIDITTLAKLALCRRPRPTSYSEDISQVADYVGMDQNQLKDFIRNAEVAAVDRPKTVNTKPKLAKQKSKSNRGLFFAFAAATVVLILLSAFIFLQPTSASSPGTIHVVRGEATVFTNSGILRFINQNGKVVPTGELMTVREGDTIQVSEDGLLRLKLGDGSTVDLLAGTNLQLSEFDTSQDTYRVRLGLITGKAVSRVRRLLNAGDAFELITPSSTVTVRGTVFAVEVISPSATYVACSEGVVQVLMGDQVVEVKANQEVTAVVGEPLEVQPLSIWEEPAPEPASIGTPVPASTLPASTPGITPTPAAGDTNPSPDSASDPSKPPSSDDPSSENPPPGKGGDIPGKGGDPPGKGEPPGHLNDKKDKNK